jgi:agmatine deiminase
MITDNQTDKLFLADCLPKKQILFFERFEKVLNDCKIDFDFLKNTNDIWAVDFMPIQITKEKFIQFNYNPDYLQYKKYLSMITNAESICKALNISTQKSNLIIDGGNIIRTNDKVILCDKIFYENKSIPERDIIKELELLFEVDKILFVPWNKKNDEIGHADGMIRFIDTNTVLINDYSNESLEFKIRFRMSIHNAGLDWIELPYNPYSNKKDFNANGIYINYLQMKDVIIAPIFGMKEDEQAVKIMEQIFEGQTIRTIDSNEIAEDGGILNCITWNIANK